MPDKINRNAVLRIKILLKGEYHKHALYILLHLFYPSLFPGPELGRDVVEYTDVVLLQEFKQAEIKTGVIDKYYHIRFILQYIFFAKSDITKNGGQVFQHLEKSHKGKVPNVFYNMAAGSLHIIATPAPDNMQAAGGRSEEHTS